MIPNKDDRTAEHCQELYEVLFPALKYTAKSCGYALASHGSLRRDIDLIAAPWRVYPVPATRLIDHFENICKAVVGDIVKRDPIGFVKKPCGRLAHNIYLTSNYGDGPYLDISIMPVIGDEPISATVVATKPVKEKKK